MPIYEYRCKERGHVFEFLQRITDEPLERCIHCGGKVEKLVSRSAFHLKGTGWYVTDYGKGSSSKAAGSTKKESGTDEKPDPAATPPTPPPAPTTVDATVPAT